MKSILAALFTIYSATQSSRLLLQTPVYVPAQATTSAPGTGAGAGAGTGTGTAPAQPGTTVWTAPILPSAGPGQSLGAGGAFECVLPNTDPAGCAGRLTSFANAGENFKVKCSNIGSCAASRLEFTYGSGSWVERVEQLLFSEPYAGYGATIVMDSTNSPRNQYIDKLECKAPNACMDMTVELFGGASVNDIDCAYGNYCPNCNIKICEWTSVGVKLCGTPKPCFRY